MTDNGNVAVLWFENGLLFHQVSPQVVRSRQALAAAVKCYCAGLVFFWALFAFVFFLRTGKKLDLGGFAETSVFCLIQIVNTALFICVLQLSLWLLRVRVKFREVATICCFALGGLFPIVSVSMSYFLYSAIGLAIQHGDPSQRFLRGAVYQALTQDATPAYQIGDVDLRCGADCGNDCLRGKHDQDFETDPRFTELRGRHASRCFGALYR